jgi:two-component system, NarL family, nitrate/nitrite response regulator NarL
MSSILIIEDHILFASTIKRILTEHMGLHVVDMVQSGAEALEKLPALQVDLILVDVSLPGMNGIDLVQQIHSKFTHLRCLMLSGHMTSQYVDRALEVGACGYILKEDINGILEGIPKVLNGEIYLSRCLRKNG